jgi:hypothetical protein
MSASFRVSTNKPSGVVATEDSRHMRRPARHLDGSGAHMRALGSNAKTPDTDRVVDHRHGIEHLPALTGISCYEPEGSAITWASVSRGPQKERESELRRHGPGAPIEWACTKAESFTSSSGHVTSEDISDEVTR